MTASVQSPADIVNLALSRIGHQGRIASLFDGSAPAKRALDIYGQTRDDLLRSQDWDFAERTVILTQLKAAPAGGYSVGTPWSSTYPPPPWLYEYSYPTDCLKIRCLKQVPSTDPYPMPNVFHVANDGTKVILAEISNAILVYTGQVTDPTLWNSNFIEALTASLARRLAAACGMLDQGKAEAEKDEAQDEQVTTGMAANTQG